MTASMASGRMPGWSPSRMTAARECVQPGGQRGRLALGETGVHRGSNPWVVRQDRGDPLGVVTQHDDDLIQGSGQGGVDHVSKHGLPSELQQLLRPSQP